MYVFNYHQLYFICFMCFFDIICFENVRRTWEIAQLGSYDTNINFCILASWIDYFGYFFCVSWTYPIGYQVTASAKGLCLNQMYCTSAMQEGRQQTGDRSSIEWLPVTTDCTSLKPGDDKPLYNVTYNFRCWCYGMSRFFIKCRWSYLSPTIAVTQ